jgi:hypothetical protein
MPMFFCIFPAFLTRPPGKKAVCGKQKTVIFFSPIEAPFSMNPYIFFKEPSYD